MKNSETPSHKKSGLKRNQEWRILERDLSDMIYNWVYEGRMDLLRAVII
ncbi:hypothetical protein Hdeb2414_s0023g00635471 [Helianthus debilis subsp. tardiflorus]